MMLIRGSELSKTLQSQVKRMFMHRFTKEHKPEWAYKNWKNGKPYPVQFDSDNDWLKNTFFKITKKGCLDKRAKFCESHPTWPDNPELR